MAVDASEFNPGKNIAGLTSSIMGAKVESPEDALKLFSVMQAFILTGAVILGVGRQEANDALSFYELTEGGQRGRPKKVVTPITHAESGIRLMAGRLPKAEKLLRALYAEDMAKARAKRTGGAGGRKFEM